MNRIISIILIFLSIYGYSQKNAPGIENIKLSSTENKILIHYDIINSDSTELHSIQLYFSDEAFVKYYFPVKVTGDIGIAVKGGKNKCITWNVSEEMNMIPENITPHLIFNDEKIDFHNGGPSNFWLSLMVPGLGDYFVADPKNMKFKPYLRTMASYSLITLGIIAAKNRTAVTKWVDPFWKYNHKNKTWKLIEGHYKEIGEFNYHFFNTDAEILIAAGAAIWAIDILWVAAKGSKNKKYKGQHKFLEDVQTTSYLSCRGGGLQFNYIIRF